MSAPVSTYGVRDALANFHGNQLVYICWDQHLSFCAPMAFPLPPAMPFGALVSELIPQFYGMHPDFARIDWSTVEWRLDGEPFTPKLGAGLTDNGIGHKSVLRFTTPGLDGFRHSAS